MNNASRRRFLQSVLAVGAGSLISSRLAIAGLSRPHVLLVGNGVGGQAFAIALKRLAPDARITIVDPDHADVGCHQPGYLSDVVTRLDLHRRVAQTASGTSIGYDVLVLSPGADIRWHAIEGYTPTAAQLMPHGWMGNDRGAGLRSRLASLSPGATVIVYVPRGGIRFPAGVNQRIDAISRYLKRNNPRGKLVVLDARQFANEDDRAVAGRSVEWLHLSADEDIVAVDPAASTLYNSASHSFRGDLVNLIPPQQAGRIAHRYGLVDRDGWCPVDASTSQSLAGPGIYVLGDASAAENATKDALTASRQALLCAEHLANVYA